MKLVFTSFVCSLVFCPGCFVFGQNVGIGTANPISKFHVLSNADADGILIDNSAPNGDPILQFGLDGLSVVSMGLDDSDGDKFKIGTSAITSNTRLTIQPNGFIGIGTTSPSYHLHVAGFRPNDYLAFFENTSASGSGIVGYTTGTYNGLGGITNNPAGLGTYGAHLSETGSGWAIWGVSNSSDAIGVRGSIPTGGSWLGYGGYFAGGLGYVNGLYNLSDGRMKKNIRPLENSVEKVMQLRGVSYQYNTEEFGRFVGNDNKIYVGFVAQEVERVFPEAVAEKTLVNDGPEIKGQQMDMGVVERKSVKVVDYVSLVPVLVEAIKEQQHYIEQLESRIKELEDNK